MYFIDSAVSIRDISAHHVFLSTAQVYERAQNYPMGCYEQQHQ